MREPSPDAPLRTYRLEPLRRNVFLAVAAVIAVIGLLFGGFALLLLGSTAVGLEPLDFVIAGVPTAAFLAGAAAIVLAAQSIRLELSVEGITLRVPGAVVSAAWDDVADVALVPWSFLGGQALILRRPARTQAAWWFHFIEPELLRDAIPIAPFALPLRGSRLEAELASRLPRLFEEAAAG